MTADAAPPGEPSRAPALEPEWDRAIRVLNGAAEICLACHVRPDGDALGSMLAVAHALRGRARVIASFGELPFEIPGNLRFLPGTDLLSPPDAYPERPRVMVTLDVSSAGRLGLLEARASRAAELIVIDHHASNTRFGSVNLIDPSAAATAVLAFDLIGRLGVPLSREMASGLYTGLVTDTGSFRYSSTTPRVHQLAAGFIETGIQPAAIAHELWDRAEFGLLGLLSAALGRARLEPDEVAGRGLVWTTVTRDDRAERGLPFDAAESVIDVLRRTDEAAVAVVLREDDAGRWEVSTRAKDSVDVGQVCVALGGGGHPRAAGFTADGTAAEVMAVLRAQFAGSTSVGAAGGGR